MLRSKGCSGQLGDVDLREDFFGVKTADNTARPYDLDGHGAGIHVGNDKILGISQKGLADKLDVHAAEGLLEFFGLDACDIDPDDHGADQ